MPDTTPPKRSFVDRLLGRTNSGPQGNAKLVGDLIATFQQFSRETVELQKAFRAAQARTLSELSVPIDELRGTSRWLHTQKMTFYQ
jgi:hypothetical protein